MYIKINIVIFSNIFILFTWNCLLFYVLYFLNFWFSLFFNVASKNIDKPKIFISKLQGTAYFYLNFNMVNVTDQFIWQYNVCRVSKNTSINIYNILCIDDWTLFSFDVIDLCCICCYSYILSLTPHRNGGSVVQSFSFPNCLAEDGLFLKVGPNQNETFVCYPVT